MNQNTCSNEPLQVGWATCDITPPDQPVLVLGQFHARVSEGVDDPLSATALVLSSGDEQVTFLSCDIAVIPNELRDAVFAKLGESKAGPAPEKILFNATHTHAGPEVRLQTYKGDAFSSMGCDVELQTVHAGEYLDFLAGKLAACVRSAWHARKPGKIAYGLDYATVGRNRRWVDKDGISTMYGLKTKEAHERFRHIEGYEDHSLNLLATYDSGDNLTGVLVNIPCPSQESENSFRISADYWCETRHELRSRFGDNLFILPQCSSAGDLTSHLLYEQAAHNRMLKLRGRTAREEIACRIADAVGRILSAIKNSAAEEIVLTHHVEQVALPLNRLTQADADNAHKEANDWKAKYEEELKKLQTDPDAKNAPRWYVPGTRAFRRMNWNLGVVRRYEDQQQGKGVNVPAEVHVVRLGDIAFASNPFEYYLDFGIQIKVRSPFIQTFLVQLSGPGTYVPSPRSVAGGGYGSVPASNPIGPEGGQILADRTVEILRRLYG